MSDYQRWSGGYVFKNQAKFKKFLKGIQQAWLEWDLERHELAQVAYAARHLSTTGKWKKLMKQKGIKNSNGNFADLVHAAGFYDFWRSNYSLLSELDDLNWREAEEVASLLRQDDLAIEDKMYKPKKPKKRDLSKGFYLGDFEFSVYPKALGVYADNNRPSFWDNPVGQWILKNYKSYGGSDQTTSVSEYDEDEWGNSMY